MNRSDECLAYTIDGAARAPSLSISTVKTAIRSDLASDTDGPAGHDPEAWARVWVVTRNEVDARRLEHRPHHCRSQKPVELGYDQDGLRTLGVCRSLAEFRAIYEIMLFASLHLGARRE